MARHRGSVTKLSRNSGQNLDGYPKVLKSKKNYPSGQHGQARRKPSEYGIQLAEKQKVKRTYDVLEKQFRRYYDWAAARKGVTGTLLLQRLETRLDNVVYRSGLVKTRRQGRQLIAHGHVAVNGRKVDIPSYLMRTGDMITIQEQSRPLLKQIQEDMGIKPVVPGWLQADIDNQAVKFLAAPQREDIDPTINEQLIVELYSR